MTPRKTDTPGSETGGADYLTTTNTPNPNTSITTTDGASFGVMLDRPLTTTRRCEGAYCWCQAGSTIAWPLNHDQEMARMAGAIRSLDIAGGVLGI